MFMRKLIFFVISFCSVSLSCSSIQRTPLCKKDVLVIAKKAVVEHEKWPPSRHLRYNITQTICYQTTQNVDGSWSVIAHQSIMEVNSGNLGFVRGTKRIILIGKSGKIIRYIHDKE